MTWIIEGATLFGTSETEGFRRRFVTMSFPLKISVGSAFSLDFSSPKALKERDKMIKNEATFFIGYSG